MQLKRPIAALRAGKRTSQDVAEDRRVVVYARLSTERQYEKENSIETQMAKCEYFAKAHGFEIVGRFSEAGSGKSMKGRVQLAAALAVVNSGGAGGILVSKLDRLTRRLRDLMALVEPAEPGVKAGPLSEGRGRILSVHDMIDTRTATGRMFLSFVVMIAQWEREMIGERTKDVMRHMRSKDEYTGGHIPYGRKLVGGKLVKDNGELAVMASIVEFLNEADVDLPLHIISRCLDERQIRSRNGAPLAPAQVLKMLAAVQREFGVEERSEE